MAISLFTYCVPCESPECYWGGVHADVPVHSPELG